MYIRQVGTRGPARRAGQVCEGGAAEGDAGPAAAGGSDVDLADGVWKVEPDRALVHLPPGRPASSASRFGVRKGGAVAAEGGHLAAMARAPVGTRQTRALCEPGPRGPETAPRREGPVR